MGFGDHHGKRKFEWKRKATCTPSSSSVTEKSDPCSPEPSPSKKHVHFFFPDDDCGSNLPNLEEPRPLSIYDDCHSALPLKLHAFDSPSLFPLNDLATSSDETFVSNTTPFVDDFPVGASERPDLQLTSSNRTEHLLNLVNIAKSNAIQSIPSLRSCLKKPGCRLADPT